MKKYGIREFVRDVIGGIVVLAFPVLYRMVLWVVFGK